MSEHLRLACELVRAVITRPGMYLKRHTDLEEIACMMHGFDTAGVAYKKCGGQEVRTFTHVFHMYVMDLFPWQGAAMGWANMIKRQAMEDCPPNPRMKCQWQADWFLFLQVFDEFEALHKEG